MNEGIKIFYSEEELEQLRHDFVEKAMKEFEGKVKEFYKKKKYFPKKLSVDDETKINLLGCFSSQLQRWLKFLEVKNYSGVEKEMETFLNICKKEIRLAEAKRTGE